ncbi:MAG: TRAP transporter small permease [Vannielia sp.]|uniref:TRAP transporter small permease n=1 Tax=Vannielia sp. TaxID=2813045 RepID=UPI003B8DD11A
MSHEDDTTPAPERLPGPVTWLDTAAVVIAGLVLFGMMSMTFLDVLGRYLLNAPLGFAFEMTEIGMAVLVFAALPSVTLRGAHVTVGLFETFFRDRLRLVRDLAWHLVIAACFAGAAWKLSTLAARFLRYGDRTSVLHLPVGWITWFGVVCLALAALASLTLAALRLRRYLSVDTSPK